jgi:serine/threonine protein kinase
MMSRDKWEAIKKLFEAALEQDSALRSSFLKQRCEDTSERAEVERLLAEHDQAGGFLSTPVLAKPRSQTQGAAKILARGRARNIGPYIVLGEVGRGAMGIVYKAKDPINDKTVAIKLIQGSAASNQQGRMGLVREARSAGTLHHPNILEIYDIGQYKGWLYLVMEYLHGAPLNKIIQRGNNLQTGQKLEILVQLCEALDHAHSHGIVHRDIKPGNIFVTREHVVKVVDFGIAIQSDVAGNRPIAGTIPYLAPEQLKGAQQDTQSDLWSVGITMYELLTGKLPFSGPNLLYQIGSAPVPQLDPSMPLSGDLNRVLNKALAKNKNARYSAARALIMDLRSLQMALQISSYPTIESIEAVCVDNDPLAKPEPTDLNSKTPDQQGLAHQPDYLRQLELGFRCQASGQVAIRSDEFEFKRLLRGVGTLFNQLISWVVALSFMLPFVVVMLFVVFVVALSLWRISLPMLVGVLIIKIAELMSRHPRCHSCFLPMSHTSRWTRFVKTQTEVLMGYRDCTAALQEGLWQEAAKLLNVHGFEPSSFFSTRFISTPLRYHLDFYECNICAHHAARITADELVDEKWVSGLKFTEAYQGTKLEVISAAKLVRSILPRIACSIGNSVRYGDPIRLSTRAFGVSVAALLGALVITVLVLLSHRASKINAAHFARATQSPSSTAKVDSVIFARNEGLAWYHGNQRSLDRQKAAWYFEFAAKHGDSFSANMLGTMFERALGVPQNYDKAITWYKEAAQKGNADAEFNLGRLYEGGIGLPKDIAAAMNWYNLAVKAGSTDAANRLVQLKPQ